jgi:hypothetical protein
LTGIRGQWLCIDIHDEEANMKVLLLYPEFPDTFWSFKHAHCRLVTELHVQ